MGINRGKQFEQEIEQAFKEVDGISIDRLPDPMAGFMGVRNICDYYVYRYPYAYYIECKSFRGNTLNFKSGITENQWNGLLEKSKIKGIVAGIMVWFIDHDVTVFIKIDELKRLQDEGNKSLNIKNINNNDVRYHKIDGKKRRVLFTYDMNTFISKGESI